MGWISYKNFRRNLNYQILFNKIMKDKKIFLYRREKLFKLLGRDFYRDKAEYPVCLLQKVKFGGGGRDLEDVLVSVGNAGR